MARGAGFEPTSAESKSAVLPVRRSPKEIICRSIMVSVPRDMMFISLVWSSLSNPRRPANRRPPHPAPPPIQRPVNRRPLFRARPFARPLPSPHHAPPNCPQIPWDHAPVVATEPFSREHRRIPSASRDAAVRAAVALAGRLHSSASANSVASSSANWSNIDDWGFRIPTWARFLTA